MSAEQLDLEVLALPPVFVKTWEALERAMNVKPATLSPLSLTKGHGQVWFVVRIDGRSWCVLRNEPDQAKAALELWRNSGRPT